MPRHAHGAKLEPRRPGTFTATVNEVRASKGSKMIPSRCKQSVRSVRFGVAAVAAMGMLVALSGSAQAATTQPPVGLGTATSYAVLAGTAVTNTGSSTISGNLGVNPGTAVSGFPPGLVTNGTRNTAGPVALQAQSDLTTAYLDAAGRTPFTAVPVELGGRTLKPGVYAGGTLGLTGTLTLDAGGNPNAVFIFKAASTLITGPGSRVNLINGASPCNVFWQLTSSATLGAGSTFRGTIMALTSISLKAGATVDGRVLARNGKVSLISDTITKPACQVMVVPSGAVRTGDGSTSGGGNGARALWAGALLLAGASGSTLVAARRRRLHA